MNSKKINLDFSAIFGRILNFFKNFSKLPRDEQYSYIAIAVGAVFIVLGLII